MRNVNADLACCASSLNVLRQQCVTFRWRSCMKTLQAPSHVQMCTMLARGHRAQAQCGEVPFRLQQLIQQPAQKGIRKWDS